MVGAGAAGLVAAIHAAAGPRPVVVVERTADGGRKILISGGGRCNILPAAPAPERFVTDSPSHLMRGLLRAWPLDAMRRFFETEVGVPLALERESAKWFPQSNRARDVRDGLIALARRRGVSFRFQTSVTGLSRTPEGWIVETVSGPVRASRVILATGGLSVPATGSDGTGLRIAAALGHVIHDTYPALTPLTYDPANGIRHAAPRTLHPALFSGLSLPVRIRARWRGDSIEASGGFLFTHRGYSGPAVLDVSHVCVRSLMDIEGRDDARERAGADRATLRVAWSDLPAAAWHERLAAGDRAVATIVAGELPERLAHALLALAGVPRDRRTSSLTRSERNALVNTITACELPWSGHEGFKKAEVTGGGVALDTVHKSSLESRHHAGLFLCGEMLDAFGPIGGHNFAWAWSTGRAAGLASAREA